MKNPQLHTASTIRTLSGKYVDVLSPTPDMFDIEDIAHSLSQQCRFGGHLREFYSVAQHSCYVSKKVSKKNQLSALMHDAAEFVMLDMPRPIKQNLLNYKDIENGILKVLAEKFGFEYPLPSEVKQADEFMLEVEFENLVIGPQTNVITTMSPPVAKNYFLLRFKELTEKN